MINQKCPFCFEPEEKARKILKEGRHVRVILSNPRLMVAHTLVIPKRHVATFPELSEEELTELFKAAIHFQEKLKKLHPYGGCDLSQHDRPFMPTTRLTIPGHLHIHLRPRFFKDRYYKKVLIRETRQFGKLTEEEENELLELLAE